MSSVGRPMPTQSSRGQVVGTEQVLARAIWPKPLAAQAPSVAASLWRQRSCH